MFNKTKMFLNKYKLENLAKHNLNNDITSNSNLEFIKDKTYLDNNYKDLDKKENYKKTKKQIQNLKNKIRVVLVIN